MWDLLESQTEPVSPALAGRFFTREAQILLSFFLIKIQNCKCLTAYNSLRKKKIPGRKEPNMKARLPLLPPQSNQFQSLRPTFK